MARKPPEMTVFQNVLENSCGGLNIEDSRVATADNLNGGAYAENASERHDGTKNWRFKGGPLGNVGDFKQPSGRWPANVILQHSPGCSTDVCAPDCPSKAIDAVGRYANGGSILRTNPGRTNIVSGWKIGGIQGGFTDKGYPSRYFIKVNQCG